LNRSTGWLGSIPKNRAVSWAEGSQRGNCHT
jgi:hypothetical protein